MQRSGWKHLALNSSGYIWPTSEALLWHSPKLSSKGFITVITDIRQQLSGVFPFRLTYPPVSSAGGGRPSYGGNGHFWGVWPTAGELRSTQELWRRTGTYLLLTWSLLLHCTERMQNRGSKKAQHAGTPKRGIMFKYHSLQCSLTISMLRGLISAQLCRPFFWNSALCSTSWLAVGPVNQSLSESCSETLHAASQG